MTRWVWIVSVRLSFFHAGLLTSSISLAQSPAVAILRPAPVSLNCPVEVKVSREVPGRLLLLHEGFEQAAQTRSGPSEPATSVRLSITNPTRVSITAVDILIHGSSSSGWRIENAHTGVAQPFEIGRSFSLLFKIKAMTDASTQIEAPGFSTVGQVDITSVTFENGSSWHESAKTSCHATPGFSL